MERFDDSASEGMLINEPVQRSFFQRHGAMLLVIGSLIMFLLCGIALEIEMRNQF